MPAAPSSVEAKVRQVAIETEIDNINKSDPLEAVETIKGR